MCCFKLSKHSFMYVDNSFGIFHVSAGQTRSKMSNGGT